MSEKPKNPSAFPRIQETEFTYGELGMTLRDYFAGQTVIGLSGDKGFPASIPQSEAALIIAKTAYLLADAMLKAREEPT